jgi:hypothetical protein
MTARVAIGVDARERLRRLSVVFAVELRLMIVSELYMREMSTKRFHEEFGGGSASRVNKNFKVLEDESWLRYVRSEGPGGDRRGGTEHFYRATEPAFFDRETWGFMPYSVRVISSWNMFKRAVSRLRGALEVSRAGAGDTRDLTCTRFLLDEKGWTRAIDAATAHFVRVFDEQEDSRRRAGHSGEELIRTDVFSVVFESPTGEREPAVASLIETRHDTMAFFPERLAPILKDEVCLEIVSELNRREMSVTQFHRELGGASKGAIGRRFKALERNGWASKAAKETGGKRRGATEQFYRATKPAIPSYDPCADPPSLLLGMEGWCAFEQLCGQMREAMVAGSFDARLDRFISWSFVSLDRQGRRNVIEDTEELFDFFSDEQARAGQRIAKSGEEPVTMTVGLAVLEASKELTKAP